MSCSLKACAPCKLNTCSLCREARYAAINILFCKRGPDSLNGGGQDAEAGGGRAEGAEALLWSSSGGADLPQSLCRGSMVGWWIPLRPPRPSAQGSHVCCIKHSAFAVACKVVGCFMPYFKGKVSAGACWWLRQCRGQPETCPGFCGGLSPRAGLRSSPLEGSSKPPYWQHRGAEAADSARGWGLAKLLAGSKNQLNLC